MAQERKISRDTDQVVAQQRDVQREVKKADEQNNSKQGGAMQAGARKYPEPPFPKQHQPKPGMEREGIVAWDFGELPMYDAPYYPVL